MVQISDMEFQTMQMTADFSANSGSHVSETLRSFVDSVAAQRSTFPSVVPHHLTLTATPEERQGAIVSIAS